MNLGPVARLLAGFVGVFTLLQLPPLVVALVEPESPGVQPLTGFVASMLTGTAATIALWLFGQRRRGDAYRKETIAVAGLAWFLAGVLGGVPFFASGLLPHPIDGTFESISGLTTTGATVLGCRGYAAIEDAPSSLLLWRALLQWLGGIGIVLVFVALLPAMGVAAKNLLASESVGLGTDSFQQRAVEKARIVAWIYLLLTASCTTLLVVVGGFGWFDALCHAFTATATGGFSTRGSLAAFDSLGGELVLVVFMFLGGASLAVIAAHCRTGVRCLGHLAQTAEFKTYAAATALLVSVLTLALLGAGLPLATAVRQATFNGISVLTSTGYATADYHAWPALATIPLFCAMLVGGCSGSTAGGFKQVRLLVILRLVGYTVRHFVRPKSVERIKLDNEVLPAAAISQVLAVVLLWLLTIAVGAIVIAFDPRLNFVSALATSASMVGSCGPAMTIVDPASAAEVIAGGGMAETLSGSPNVGPFGGYGELAPWTKVVLSIQMVLGRLELLTVLALFSPSLWRR
jgi:trk system potassium uptake protein